MILKTPRHVVDKTAKYLPVISANTSKEIQKSGGLALSEEFEIVLPGGDRACICRLFDDGIGAGSQYVTKEKTTPIEIIFKA